MYDLNQNTADEFSIMTKMHVSGCFCGQMWLYYEHKKLTCQ